MKIPTPIIAEERLTRYDILKTIATISKITPITANKNPTELKLSK